MSKHTKEAVITQLETKYGIRLFKVSGKKVFYMSDLKDNRSLLVASPESKIHPNGHAWIDLTEIQRNLLRSASEGIVAFRLPEQKTYFVNFLI